jgi:hypothetical protein
VAFFVAFFDFGVDFVAFFDFGVDFFGTFFDFGVDFFVAFFDFGVDFVAFLDFGVDFVAFLDFGVAFLDLDFEEALAPNPCPTHIASIAESSGFSLCAGILLFGIVLSDFRLFPGLSRSILGLSALTFDRLDFFDRLDLALDCFFGGILGGF